MVPRAFVRPSICPTSAPTAARVPEELPRQRNGITPQMHGRYPDYNVLDEADHWDEVDPRLVLERWTGSPDPLLHPAGGGHAGRVLRRGHGPGPGAEDPRANFVDAKLWAGQLDGFRFAGMPDDRETWRRAAVGLDAAARQHGAEDFPAASDEVQHQVVDAFHRGELRGEVWDELAGQAGVQRPHASGAERVLLPPLGLERDRLRRARLPTGLRPPGRRPARELGGRRRPLSETRSTTRRRRGWRGRDPRLSGHGLRTMPRGALRPPENDSAFLLDVHRRAVPRERMARYDADYAVDLVIVGAGAGGSTLAQRLARRGWRIVILEAGPFWDPDADWVSDEAGSHKLYWTDERVTGGQDPVELGKNNSGRGVGGSMVHYAGYCPRFHPSDFEVRSGTEWGPTGRSPTGTSSRITSAWSWSCPWPARAGPGATRTATRTPLTRSPAGRSWPGRRPAGWASRCGWGPWGSPTAASATARTASTAASACRAAR